jgi:hypothetical protein
MRKLYVAAWLFLALSAVLILDRDGIDARHVHPVVGGGAANPNAALSWFAGIRPHCNPVEVETRHAWSPPPATPGGTAYSAACFALAGRIDEARARIKTLEGDDRWRAAGVVFNVGHPVADAGNDAAAGPIMELVVEFWPNHYMALYHAGMARLGLGDSAGARRHLERFLEEYGAQDGWTAGARRALAEMEGA